MWAPLTKTKKPNNVRDLLGSWCDRVSDQMVSWLFTKYPFLLLLSRNNGNQ